MLKKVIDLKMSVRQLEEEIKAMTQREKEIKISDEPVDVRSTVINNSPLLPTSNISNAKICIYRINTACHKW